MYKSLVEFIKREFGTQGMISLHEPIFLGNEKKYTNEAIDSTFVSSVGEFVSRFEAGIAQYTKSPSATAVMNGTAAIHLALVIAGVKKNDLVITQALTFVATCNAIIYCGADPLFIDVDRHTMDLSPSKLETWLEKNAYLDDDGICHSLVGGRVIRACLPMHTFGHPVEIDELLKVCKNWGLVLVEDAAESLGSLYKGQHAGTFGRLGTLSFNGNKILTTGGGGMVLSNKETGAKAKHLSTTAKVPHAYEFTHDELGYNYRMPNINAALGCAQLEQLDGWLRAKRVLAGKYAEFFDGGPIQFFMEPQFCTSNYWLNAVICRDLDQRTNLLKATNDSGIMTRPIWNLMHRLDYLAGSLRGDLSNSEWLERRVLNLPSGVIKKNIE